MACAGAVWQIVASAVMLFGNYFNVPIANTKLTHFDTIIVLGTPCTPEGKPSLEQRERVLEGVREYNAGVAGSLIMTGGAAHNEFTEANCMKRFAVEQGVPKEAVIEEGQAKDTIQNIYFSNEIMQQHGWKSAEVVSSPSHLSRTALILKHYGFIWRTHASRWPPEYDEAHIRRLYAGEAKYCWTLTHTGFKHSQWLPGS